MFLFPVLRNQTTEEQVLPFSMESFEINASLLNAPKMFKDFVHPYKNKKKIIDLQEHIDEERIKQSSKFGSYLNSFLADMLLFSAALVTIIITLVIICMVCGQSKLKTLVANSLTVHQRNRSSRSKKPSYILYLQGAMVYHRYVVNNFVRHDLSGY